MSPSPRAGCTIVASNYLAQARVLARSFRSFHPDAAFYVLLADDPQVLAVGKDEPFTLVRLKDLAIDDLPALCFRYTLKELNTAVKPALLQYLFAQKGHETILYLDPDILILDSLHPLFEALDGTSILLTPHITEPIPRTIHPGDTEVLHVGTYNLGFLGVRSTPQTARFLAWWHDRLRTGCLEDPRSGYFVDQKWVDLAPSFIDDVHILRDPGYNVAYWNLHERTVTKEQDRYMVNGKKLRFYHFSGFVPDHPHVLTKYITTHRLADQPAVEDLHRTYAQLLRDAGYNTFKTIPYAFETFTNGCTIPPAVRRLFADEKLETAFPQPFETKGSSYFNYLQEPVVSVGNGAHLTRLHLTLRRYSPDLQAAFPAVPGADAHRYTRHLLEQSSLPPPFLRSLASLETPTVAARSFFFRRHTWKSYQRFCRLLRILMGETLFLFLRSLVRGERTRKPPPTTVTRQHIALRPFGVNVSGYLATTMGVSEATRGNIQALEAAGIPFALHSFDHITQRREASAPRKENSAHPYRFNLLQVNADQVALCAQQMGGPDSFCDRYSIGYWMWEVTGFPAAHHTAFRWLQEIWTASTFTRDILAPVSPLPIQVIPHVVQVSPHRVHERRDFGLPEDRFLFVFVFDFYSVFERKNPLGIVQAFQRAFRPHEPVTIVFKSIHGHAHPQEQQALQDALEGLPSVHIDAIFSREKTEDLIACCDAFISLHRSEGFGLTLAEAMLLGKPVIATEYGGNADFMNDQNSFLVPSQTMTLPRPYGPYPQGTRWREPDLEHAAHCMRTVFENREEVASKAQRGKESIERAYSPSIIGSHIRDRLTLLAASY